MFNVLRVSACLLFFASGASAAQTLSSQDLAVLIGLQGTRLETLSCAFTQTITTPMFTAPLRSSGRFVFRAPDSLRWEYLKPLEQGFILTKERLVRWENGKDARSVTPPEQDKFGALPGRQLLLWISADTEMIGRDYGVTLISREPLELSLVPRSVAARDVVKELRLIFAARGIVSNVWLTESSGGSTRLDFFDVRLNEPINPEEFD